MTIAYLTGLFVVLGVMSIPDIYRAVAGLELGDTGPQAGLRLIQSLVCLTLAAVIWANPRPFRPGSRIGWVLLAVALVIAGELSVRVAVKWLPAWFKRSKRPARLRDLVYQASQSFGMYSWIDPHPFLQFTRPRASLPGGDQNIGFLNVKLSDVQKPAGVIRIACLGGSTTEDGYPELLQEYLDSVVSSTRFQVLNFGIGWWSSIHTMLNFVLNVREFRPDVVVLHDNCNDDKYRGYPGFRGDCSHAYIPVTPPRDSDQWMSRFSVLYRFIKIAAWRASGEDRPSVFVGEIGLRKGKAFQNYGPKELNLFRRNLETMCTLASADGITVVLLTMPYSNVRCFSKEHDRVFRPHMRKANDVIRRLTEEKGVRLVDLDRLLTGREELFRDPIHVRKEGNQIKALEVGMTILSSLGIPRAHNDQWGAVELLAHGPGNAHGSQPLG
jgi:hypothetical protein